ncbi:MAG: hypothetical protein ACJ75B_16970 [Flavisolibacter sp.]
MTIKRKLQILCLIASVTFQSCYSDVKDSSFVTGLKDGDSLLLYAYYADCGEWGGHSERVSISKKNGDLIATFFKDTVRCDTIVDATRRDILRVNKEVTTTGRKEINRYIQSLIIQTKKKEAPISNAAKGFLIVSKDTTIRYVNWEMNWKGFDTLKNVLFQIN